MLLLCSDNHLGLADHPLVRDAAADAAMRYGVGAASARPVSGTMRIHRRLEERLADFHGHERTLLMGSRYLALVGAIPALARAGEAVLVDAAAHPAAIDGCRLAEAETFAYRHGDLDHLEWGLLQAGGRGSLIVTEGCSPPATGRRWSRSPSWPGATTRALLVDESHAVGAVGDDGRGAAVAAGVADDVDVLVGSLATALGSYGGYVACDRSLARYLAGAMRTFTDSTAPAPPAVAGAMAALGLLRDEPRRVEKLQRNAATLRAALAAEGLPPLPGDSHIVSVHVGPGRGCRRPGRADPGEGPVRVHDHEGRHRRAAAERDGVAYQVGAGAGGPHAGAGGALACARPPRAARRGRPAAAPTGGVFDGLAEAA